jgi:putative aldouronate transport system permease protein
VKALSKKRLNYEFPLHLMLIPGIIVVLVYAYYPMLGIVMAFEDFQPVYGFFHSRWVGLENFRYVFMLPDFTMVVRNSLYLSLLKICFGILVPLILSLLINEIQLRLFKRFVQTSIFIPFFLSWVVLGGIIFEIFALTGPVNGLLGMIGIKPIYFLGDNRWFPCVLVLTDVWKGMGYNMIIFLAAITNIDPSLYEAAVVDGATKWKQTLHVTLPGMLPIIILVTTLSIGNILNAGFEQVFVLYSQIVYKSSDIIDTFVYRMGLVSGQLSPAAAVGLFKSAVSLVLVSLSYYLAYKFSDYRIF